MPDDFGALELPVPAPEDPTSEAVGDPLLDLVASFMQAVINSDVGDAWASVVPSRGASAATTTSLPVLFTDTSDPDEAAFTSKRTPCLYVWRSDEPAPQRIRITQGWETVRSQIALLLVFPPPTQSKQKLRTNIRNAIDKAVRAAVRQGRHPAWVQAGDTRSEPETYGSVFLPIAKLQAWQFTGFKRHLLVIEDEDGKRGTPFPGILGGLLVDEQLVRGRPAFSAISHVQGSVTVGNDELAEGGIAFGSYKFLSALTACVPSTGAIAGGTSVTLSGRQFFLDEDDAGLTVALDDGTELTDVVLVDESTITATMPAHAAGLVGLVVTLPSGASAELAAAFTYA